MAHRLVRQDESTGEDVSHRETAASPATPEWHVDENLKKTRAFPENIYGAAMIALARDTSKGKMHFTTIPVFFILLLNIAVQAYVMWAVKVYVCAPTVEDMRELYGEYESQVVKDGQPQASLFEKWPAARKADLCQVPLSQPPFFMVILCIWTANIMIDLRETTNFLAAFHHLPAPDDAHESKVDLVDGELVVEAASTKLKAAILILVVIPKVAIALALWWLGARWLTATASFQDLILNCAALAFITDIDEMVYAALFTQEFAEKFALFTIRLQGGKNSNNHTNMAHIILKIIVIVAIPYIYLTRLQMVLPNYHWDVRGPCEAHFDLMEG